MNIEKRLASEVMGETFRYYEGSRILRELGFHGCGNYWSRRGESRLTVGYHQTFESALRDPRVRRRLQQLYFEEVKKSMLRVGRAIEERVRPAMEAIKKAAQDPAYQQLARISAGVDSRNQLLREECQHEMQTFSEKTDFTKTSPDLQGDFTTE